MRIKPDRFEMDSIKGIKKGISRIHKESVSTAVSDADYFAVKDTIPSGLDLRKRHQEARGRILDVLGGTEEDWKNYKWQLKNRITDLRVLQRIINLSENEVKQIQMIERLHRFSISPFYASLMDPDDSGCPIRLQAVPSIEESVEALTRKMPLKFQDNSPAPLISRLFPDRLIIKLTNMCTVFCRHCQRKEDIDGKDIFPSLRSIEMALDYVRDNGEIRDVLLTGGDALALSDQQLDWILTELGKIPHVEIKRLGSRIPCVLPQRITPDLCRVLEKHDPVYLNTQFNHPREITEEARKAVDMLTRAGVVVRDQTVLLKGVNDHAHLMKKLMQELLRIKVAPYYLFMCKRVEGIMHFCTSTEEGLRIVEQLQGYTSGMAVPRLMMHVPDGRGKVPISPRIDPPEFD